MKKNIASQVVCFHMLSTTDGSDVTSGTPVVYVTGNGGTQATGSGTITHEGHGEWSYVPTQAETNYDHIAFTMVLSGAFSQTVNVYTTYPQTGDSYTAVGALNDLDSAAVNAACDTALSDYGANTTTPPTVAEIRAEIDSNSTQLTTTIPGLLTTIDTVVDGIKASTDNLPSDPADESSLEAYIDALQTHGDANWGSSGENPNVLLSAEISSVTSQTEIVLAAGSDQDDAYNGQSIVLYDDSNSDYPSVRVVVDYVGSTKTLTIDSGADFTVGADDSIRIFVTSPGSIAPTASQVADAVWDEAIADHIISTTFGGKNQIAVPSATLDDYKADVSGVATASALATVDTVVDAIKLKTDNLPSDPADQNAIEAAITSAHNTTDGKIDALNDFDPDNDTVAHVTLVDTTTANTDMVTDTSSNVSAIKAVTDLLPDSGALSSIAQASVLSEVLLDTGTTIPGMIENLNDPTAETIVEAIMTEVLPDVSTGELIIGQPIPVKTCLRANFNRFFREVTQTNVIQTVKNDSGVAIATMATIEEDGTQTKGTA